MRPHEYNMKNRLRKNEALDGKPAFKKADPRAFANDAEVACWAIHIAKTIDSAGHPELWDGDPSSRAFQLCYFMVASSVIGPDEKRLSAMFNINLKLAAMWAENLRRSGLWLPDGTVVNDSWFDPHGDIGFTMDCLVADGLLDRQTRPDMEPIYSAAPGRAPHDEN